MNGSSSSAVVLIFNNTMGTKGTCMFSQMYQCRYVNGSLYTYTALKHRVMLIQQEETIIQLGLLDVILDAALTV